MIDPLSFIRFLESKNLRSYVGVPDSLLKDLISCLSDNLDSSHHIISANEGNAIGIASGLFMASGEASIVYLQNSGLGNIVNPLLSLADPDVYSIPMLLLIGWRGEPGVKDEPQHFKQGQVTLPLLEAMDIPYFLLNSDTENPFDIISQSISSMHNRSGPAALVISKNTFCPYVTQSSPESIYSMSREEAISHVINALPANSYVVSTTGMASRELFELREKSGSNHDHDFLTVGSMGHASSIAFGLSLHSPTANIICLDGDGALLMHLGSLAVIADSKPSNLIHILLNNGSHDSVGGQPTVGHQVDFCSVAASLGYEKTFTVSSPSSITSTLTSLSNSPGPVFLEIKIKKGYRLELGRPTSKPLDNRLSFSKSLRSSYI